MTTIYKRTVWYLIKSILLAPLAPVAVFFVLLWLMQFFPNIGMYIATITLPILIFVFTIYNAVWNDNIRFEITEDGRCDYYQKNKLRQSYDLTVCDFGYFKLQDANGGIHRLSLRITGQNGESTKLECEPLGKRQFEAMFKQMQSFSTVQPEKL